MNLTSVIASRLEKVAIDNGFDRELPSVGAWLVFSSTQCSLQVWLSVSATGECYVALSQIHVANALSTQRVSAGFNLPHGAAACVISPDIPTLHQLVRRAFQLSRTLPDELLHTYEAKTACLPRSTEAERLVVQRVGQDIFRHGLIEYWEGRCAITGLDSIEILRASHIKPWAVCESDSERLDVFNGLLLAPHLDALFDKGYLTIHDSGEIVLSSRLSVSHRRLLGLDASLGIVSLVDGHRPYLQHHRNFVFK